jgi:catechol 2,3-dioxygenase-like lactoylglutathione lyase family enzyme
MPMPPLPPKNAKSAFSSIRGSHVGIRVPDFQASKKWFVEKLDFRVLHEWPFADQHLAYLAPPNDDSFQVELLGDGNPNPQKKYTDLSESLRNAGYHHFCLNVESVDQTLAELRRRGVTIVGEPFNLEVISRRLGFISDPWGNIIEFAEVIS